MKKKKSSLALMIADAIADSSYDNVSVTSICEQSSFSRQNFYYYFSSIEEVIENIVDIDIEAIDEFLPGSNALRTILTIISKRQTFYKKMFETNESDNLISTIFIKKITDLYTTMAAFFASNYNINDKELAMPIFKQYAMADLSLIRDWVKGDMKESISLILSRALSSNKALFAQSVDTYLFNEKNRKQ